MSFLIPQGLQWFDREPSVIEKLWAGRVLNLRVDREWTFVSRDGRELRVSAPGWNPVDPPSLVDHLKRAPV